MKICLSLIHILDMKKLGGISGKGLTLEGKYGNEGERLWETPAGLINSIGLQNPGVRHFIEYEPVSYTHLDVYKRQKRNILTLARSGAHTVKFIDRTFNANPAHANAILAFILKHYGRDIPAGVCFHFELAGDILREETFALLEQAPPGAFQLEIGMQSFCEKTLAAVRRKTDTGVLKQNIRRLVAMGNMHVHIDLIAGCLLYTSRCV